MGDKYVEHGTADEKAHAVNGDPHEKDGEIARSAEEESAESHHQCAGHEELVALAMALQPAHEEILQHEGEAVAEYEEQAGAAFRAGQRFGEQGKADVDLHDHEPVAAQDGDKTQVNAVAHQAPDLRGVIAVIRRGRAAVGKVAQGDDDVGEKAASRRKSHDAEIHPHQHHAEQRPQRGGDTAEIVGKQIEFAPFVHAGKRNGGGLERRIKKRAAEAGEKQGGEEDGQSRRKTKHEETGGADDESGAQHGFQAVAVGQHAADESKPLLAGLTNGQGKADDGCGHADTGDEMYGNQRHQQCKARCRDALVDQQGKELRPVAISEEIAQRRGKGGTGEAHERLGWWKAAIL